MGADRWEGGWGGGGGGYKSSGPWGGGRGGGGGGGGADRWEGGWDGGWATKSWETCRDVLRAEPRNGEGIRKRAGVGLYHEFLSFSQFAHEIEITDPCRSDRGSRDSQLWG